MELRSGSGELREGMNDPRQGGMRRARNPRLVTGKRLYRTAAVVLTPVGRGIQYEILSPLYCKKQGPIRNRGTYTLNDGVWRWVFGSWPAVNRFWREGVPLRRIMRLATLGYDGCDFACLSPLGRPNR